MGMESALGQPEERAKTPSPEPSPAFKTTESMVTVRLSDPDTSSLPSPTPTLKLVDERSEEHSLSDDEPMYTNERTESPDQEESSGLAETSRRSSEDESKNMVDWEGLEKSEGEQCKVQSSEEVGAADSHRVYELTQSYRRALRFSLPA